MKLSTLVWIQIHALARFALCVSLFAEQISYSKHCSSLVPEAAPDINSNSIDTFPISQYHAGYYSGNFSNIPRTPSSPLAANSSSSSSNHFTFRTRDVQKTNHEHVLKVDADLTFRVDGFYVMESSHQNTYFPSFFHRSSRGKRIWRVLFRLEGFWSESSGKLCMVGSTLSREGDGDSDLNLKAVLRMENVKSYVNITNLFTGTLESLSSGDGKDHYSDAVSILMFPRENYQYSLVTMETRSTVGPSGTSLPTGLPLGSGRFCTTFQTYGHRIKLKHADSLPPIMSWRVLNCLEDARKLQVLLYFSKDMNLRYYESFEPNMALVGEGLWVKSNNLLQIAACRIHTDGRSFSSASVEDCSIDLSLSFPATWSIKERNGLSGEITSKKSTNESGYFDPITIKGAVTQVSELVGLKYKYTEAEKLKRLCPVKNHNIESKRQRKYPDRFSSDLTFDMSVQMSGRKMAVWGYSYPLFVGSRAYDRFAYEVPVLKVDSDDSMIKTNSSTKSRFDIAYQMGLMGLENGKSGGRTGTVTVLHNGYSVSSEPVEISAEGFYDMETGGLCMVGCRNLENSMPDSTDCEILINFQFPPLDSKKARDTIKGSIESTRKRSDPLYFDRMNVSASAFYAEQSKRSIWRLDLELSLVLISNSFSCIFLALQILYVRKHPQVLPVTSLLMLTVLALGLAIPLVLNFEALFQEDQNRQSFYLESGRRLEANEVLVRVATMVAFLFQFRLLQLSFSARLGEGGHWKSQAAENKSLLLSLPLYALGAFATLLISWKTNSENSMWGILKSYAGLVLDGFLLPQVLLNLFRDSNEKVLSIPFYAGMTLVRLVPHGYDLWRVHSFVQTQFDGSYIYGTPEADFYSTAWDVIIPLGGIILATIVYLQQRFGGCCIVPQRFQKSSVSYKKVPVISDA